MSRFVRRFLRPAVVAFALVALQGACDPGLSGFSSGGPDETDKDASDPSEGGASGTGDGGAQDGARDGSSQECESGEGGPRPEGQYCKSASDCCSNACSEQRRCVSACIAEGAGGCDPNGSTCCSGDYCSRTAGTKCQACIPKGSPAEVVSGVVNAKSCCSGKASTVGDPPKCADD